MEQRMLFSTVPYYQFLWQDPWSAGPELTTEVKLQQPGTRLLDILVLVLTWTEYPNLS